MRFLELNLKAFGPFRDVTLDLSGGGRGLHLIYGRNEAGKSSALRAISDLLFGIPAQSKDNHLVDHPLMRVGATLLSEDGSQFSFLRKKANKQTLIDPLDDKKPLDDTPLRQMLGGIDRDQFQLLFSLNQDRLREGGTNLSKGAGKLGEALFGAGTDLSRLRGVQLSLEAEAEKLFKANGRNPAINAALSDLSAARSRRAGLVLSGEKWETLRKSREEAERSAHQTKQELVVLQADLDRLQRFDDARPDLLRRQELHDALASFSDLPPLRTGFCEDFEKASATYREISVEHALLQGQQTEQLAKLDGVAVDSPWLDCAASIEALRDLWAESRAEILAIGRLQTQMEADAQAVVVAREMLGLPPTDNSPRLAVAARRKLERLRTEASTVASEVSRLELAHQKAQRVEAEAARRLAAIPAAVQPEVLKAAVADAESRLADHARLVDLDVELGTAELAFQAALASLAPWQGDFEQLTGSPVPEKRTLSEFETLFEGIENEEIKLASDLNRIGKAHFQCEQKLAEFSETLDVPTESDLSQSRQERDDLWVAIRTAGPSNTSDLALSEFEQAMERADRLADRLRREADRVATKAGLIVQIRAHQEDLARHEKYRADLERQRQSAQERWNLLWKPLGITPGTLADQRDWLARLEVVKTARGRCVELKNRQTSLREGLEQTTQALLSLFQARLPAEHLTLSTLPLPGLVARGRSLQAADEDLEKERKSLVEKRDLAVTNLSEQVTALAAARSTRDAWAEAWLAALTAAGLPSDAHPDEVGPALEDRLSYDEKREVATRSACRHAAAVERHKTLTQEGERLSQLLGLTLDRPTMEAIVGALDSGLIDQRAAASSRQTLRKTLSELESKFETATERLNECQFKLDALSAEAGCTLLELTQFVDRQRAKLGLFAEQQSVEQRLRALARGVSVAEFAAAAQADDCSTRAGRITDFEGLIAQHQERLESLNRALGEAGKEMEFMQDSARGGHGIESASEIQDLLARIGNESENYAELRIAGTLLKRSMDLYREQNQSGILNRAGSILEVLTGGSLVGLDTHDEKGELILMARRSEGGKTLAVDQMSEGTRDQLYLALKLATIEDHLRSGSVLPLVLDDLLVNFDDARSRATLQVLAELSQKTQVLMFTHHAHLVDLAESSLSRDQLFVCALGADQPRLAGTAGKQLA